LKADIDGHADRFLLAVVAYPFGDERSSFSDDEKAAHLAELADKLSPAGTIRMAENATYHELIPLLHLVTDDCARLGYPLPFPERILEKWSQVYERELVRSAVIHHGAQKALTALRDAGVRAVPLKGFFLASRYYGKGGARSYRDLDLLVEKDSLQALNEALLDAGFRPHPGRPSFVPAPAYTVYFLPVEESDVVMEIDIHVGMHWPKEYFKRTRFRSEDLWSEAVKDETDDLTTWAMSPAHLVITTLLDLAVNHRYARLIKFRDIVEAVRATEVEWDKLVFWSDRWGVKSFVGPGLKLLYEIDPGIPVPPEVLDSLMPSYPFMRLFLKVLPATALPNHRGRSFSLPNLLFFMLGDTPADRARGLAHLPYHIFRGRRRF